MGAWSFINFKDLHEGLDFDAEHYHPERLAAWSNLSTGATKTVGQYAVEIESLIEPDPARPSYDLTAALGQFLEGEGTVAATSVKKTARAGDVVVSRLRSYLREVCLMPDRGAGFHPQLSTEFIVLRTKSEESISWLLPFILSQPVQAVLRWSQTGSNHPRFSVNTLLQTPVSPRIKSILPQLNELAESAVSEFEKSRRVYPEAEAELLERLGWDELKRQSLELFYARNFSELTNAGRADAEFFQPRTQKILSRLAAQKRRVKDVAILREEIYDPERGVPFHYIEIGNVSANTLVNGDEIAGEDAPSRAKHHVRHNNVITSTVRPIRRLSGLIGAEQEGWVCSSGFAVLEPANIPPEYLVAYLRLPPVCELMDAYTTATMYPAISIPDLLNLPFFLPEKQLVERVCNAVNQTRHAYHEARKKLDKAKRLVEDALKTA